MTSTIKVNNIQNQCGANIINESSNTITIGASGDTISLASGASQTGFGRTGTVDWQTSSIKTATFTAANGEGYFANTSGGVFTMNFHRVLLETLFLLQITQIHFKQII